MCFTLVGDPVISFTWHPHGPHYKNICELHLEAFLHAKCLAVSLLQAQRPFAATNRISHLHLRPDTTKRHVQPQTANVGKSLCWGVCHFISDGGHSRRTWFAAYTANTMIFDDAHESFLTLGRCQFSLFFSAPGVNMCKCVSLLSVLLRQNTQELRWNVSFSLFSAWNWQSQVCLCYSTYADEFKLDAGAKNLGCESLRNLWSRPCHKCFQGQGPIIRSRRSRLQLRSLWECHHHDPAVPLHLQLIHTRKPQTQTRVETGRVYD